MTRPRALPYATFVRGLALIVLVLPALLGSGAAGATPPGAAPPRVVPWLDHRPVKAASNPPLAAPCKGSDLRAQLFMQGATGSLVGGVDLTNAGTAACSLVGWPSASFSGGAAAAEKWQIRTLAQSPAPPDVLADPPGSLRALQPGKSATVALFWSNWCGPGATPTGASGALPAAIVLGLASRTSITVPVANAPRCDAPQYPSTLSVGPFTPITRRLPTSSHLSLAAAIIGYRPLEVKPGLRAFRVHRGEQFRYVVALANTGKNAFRFASSSCPTYIEQLDPSAPQPYILNCRPVGAIAPGATVLFAMQIQIPSTARLGVTSLTWELAPKTANPPFTSAALWVAR